MTDIKNIVFDLGGVIFNFDFEDANRTFAELGVSLGPDAPNRQKVLRLLNDYINGFISEPDFATQLLSFSTRGLTKEAVISELQTFSGDLPVKRLEALVTLRKRYKVYLLSNINERMWQWTVGLMQKQGYNPEDCFDQVFLSYELQQAKPAPSIYQTMIDATGLNPQQTLYFDDLKENAIAGAGFGLQAHIVKPNFLEECEAYSELFKQ